MIKPTPGRIVWFTPAARDPSFPTSCAPPFAARIVHVWSDCMVNLMVIIPEGQPVEQTAVTLLQEGDPRPTHGRFCEYQKGQAAKTESLEARLKESA
jgi:hypothetical protein